MNEDPHRIGRIAVIFIASTCFALHGCISHFGTGGTGEFTVPDGQLHEIGQAGLDRYVIASTQPDSRSSTQPADSVPLSEAKLSIEECRAAALANNLDLGVELFNPAIAHTQVTLEEAAFESMFNATASYAQNRFPSAGGVPAFTQYNVTPDVNLGIPLQTGGTIKFDAPFQYFQGTYISQALNSYYTFMPNIGISQPLLRGFGFDVNAQAIRLSFYQFQQAQARTKLEVIRVLAETDRAYWHLYAARKLLEVRRKQLQLAIDQRNRAKHQADVGMMSNVDIVRAESGVADQREQIITAENSERQIERDLKRILNRADLGIDTPAKIILETAPNFSEFHLDPNRLIDAALVQRMEMLEVELQIVTETANIRYARNQLLPLLAVQYSYSHNGYSPSASETFSQAWSRNYEGQTIGLSLQFPIGNEAAKSQLRAAMLRRLQQLATREQRKEQIRQEIFDATDTLNTDVQRIAAATQRVALARRVLDVENNQYRNGLRTSTEVLDAQARLADAESSKIAAVTDYQIAQVDIAVATGTVLGATHIHWPLLKPGDRGRTGIDSSK